VAVQRGVGIQGDAQSHNDYDDDKFAVGGLPAPSVHRDRRRFGLEMKWFSL
jgi:hypothetical protein